MFASLFFQRESNFQCYLIVADSSVFNVPLRLKNFEPFHSTQGLGRAGYGILNGIFDAFLRRSDEFEKFIDMIIHLVFPIGTSSAAI